MIGFLIFITVWFVFGFIAARMVLISLENTNADRADVIATFAFFFMGPLGWLISMVAVGTAWPHLRKRAHFLPAKSIRIPIPRLPRPRVNWFKILKQIFFVRS